MRAVGILAAMALALAPAPALGQDFDGAFTDATLRLDYTFSGDAGSMEISLDKLNASPGWYGKRRRLAEVPVEGNGLVTVRDHATKETIYRNSFSSLFQEWLSYDEARTVRRSFENVFLVPMPRDTVDITVEIHGNRHETIASLTHEVAPTDILIRRIGERGLTPHATLQEARDPGNCVHVAIVAEGYTEGEMDLFMEDARRATEAIFSHEPFRSRRESFSVVAVKSASRESGTSEPSHGLWRDTAVHSHFDTFHSDRYLTTLSIKELHDILAGIPYEHIIILVNTDGYGGGGILNSYVLTMAHHRLFEPVIVHEFGHSFAGLADEYAYDFEQIPMYPHDVEPWERNITTLVDFGSKWEDMVVDGTPVPTPESDDPGDAFTRVGLFEGAGYSLEGVYRPTQDCRMRTNESPEFCPVCKRAIGELIDFYVGEKDRGPRQ